MVKKGMFIGGRYEIIDKVGAGGMADVYKAKDHKLNRNTAIKILKQEFSEDESFVSKFRMESRASAGLSHPNIVSVYDVGEDNGLYYIVMELVEGITLKKYIERKGKLPVKEAVSIAIQVAHGIEAAHANHIIHRDIKPQNIIISKEGKIKVADFGIARAASTNTINSNAMGSVHYISPEQARNGYVDEKSDIYSLGITLYEMITGSVPFEGDSTVAIALQHVQDEIPPLGRAVGDIPVSVEKIVEKCTQKKPDRRYLKISSLIADLNKSLIAPDEDFVQPAYGKNTSPMVVIMDDEVDTIKREAGIEDPEEEYYSDDEPVQGRDIDISYNGQDEDEDEFDGTNPKLDKAITIASIAAAVVILIVGIIIFVSILGKGCSGKKLPAGKTTENQDSTSESDVSLDAKSAMVPSLINKTEDEAIEALKKAELEYKITDRQKHNTIPKGRVISQSHDAGSIVDKGLTVNFTVSDGPEEVDIPENLAGKTKDEVTKIFTDLGIEVKPEFELNDTYEAGQVIRTNPSSPIKLKYGDSITIYVSQGKDSKVIMPDIKGMKAEAAETLLNEKGLSMTIVEEFSDKPKGEILTQEVRAGTTLDLKKDSNKITVGVSKGPKPTETTAAETTTPSNKKTAKFAAFNLPPEKIAELNMTDAEKESATLKARITYTGMGDRENITDITDNLSGYDNVSKMVKYSASWSQKKVISVTVEAENDTSVLLEIVLCYNKEEKNNPAIRDESKETTTQSAVPKQTKKTEFLVYTATAVAD